MSIYAETVRDFHNIAKRYRDCGLVIQTGANVYGEVVFHIEIKEIGERIRSYETIDELKAFVEGYETMIR